MFLPDPPTVRELEVFARLPDAFRRNGMTTSWAKANRGGMPTDSFLEGPVFDGQGNLFVTDIPYGRIFRVDAGGDWDLIAEYDGEPNGMKFLNDRELIITDYKNGLMACDIASGKTREYLGRRNSERFKGVNDLTFDSKGNLYFTDQGQTGMHDPTGRVYRLSPDGRLDALIVNAPSPNGIVLSPDEHFLFVAMTRANEVWRMPLAADGSVTKVGRFFSSYGPSGPDGLAMDEAGRLIVCNPGLGWAWVLNAYAQPVEILRAGPGISLTNVAFGHVNRRSAYFTDSSRGMILRTDATEPGCALHRSLSGPFSDPD